MATASEVVLESNGKNKVIEIDDVKLEISYDVDGKPSAKNLITGVKKGIHVKPSDYKYYKKKNIEEIWREQVKQSRLINEGKYLSGVQQDWMDTTKLDLTGDTRPITDRKNPNKNALTKATISDISKKWTELLGEPQVAATRTRAKAEGQIPFPDQFEKWYGAVNRRKDGFKPIKVEGRTAKKVEPSETPSGDQAIINWKKKWLWRGNDVGEFLDEHDKSPLILYKVLLRLKDNQKPDSLGQLIT